MKIGIDISQLAYEQTGVANYLENLVENIIRSDKHNRYVLFYSSFRIKLKDQISKIKNKNQNVKIKEFRLPPMLLDLIWNRLHIAPIEWFVGDVDIFITSDWTEPPAMRAKKATILYDLVVYKYPEETAKMIVDVQKRKLKWVKKESDLVLCISESTKRDAVEILEIPEVKLSVIYPGV